MPSLFPLCFPTELIRSQLFSCSGVKFPFSSPSTKPSPPPNPPALSPIKNHKHCSLHCWLLWHINKECFKRERSLLVANPHRSFTLFKQIHAGIVSVGGKNPIPSPQREDCNCMDYWDGDIPLSLYQHGYMVLKYNKEEVGLNLNSGWFSEGFKAKWSLLAPHLFIALALRWAWTHAEWNCF